jgi:periplasmic mercuric ion binding protein
MKSLKLSGLSVTAALLLACSFGAPSIADACPGKKGAHQAEKDKKKDAPARVASASFHVTGMSCDGCGEKVRTALAQTAGIVKVDVKVADKRITVDYDADKLTADKIAKLISDLGYPASAEA